MVDYQRVYGGIPSNVGTKGASNSSSYITYNNYPGNTASYKIPTYTPGAPGKRPLREDYFDEKEVNAMMSAQKPAATTPPPPIAQAASAPSTPAHDDNPMKIPCLSVYSHIRECPVCRASLASSQYAQDFTSIEKTINAIIAFCVIIMIIVCGMAYMVFVLYKARPQQQQQRQQPYPQPQYPQHPQYPQAGRI